MNKHHRDADFSTSTQRIIDLRPFFQEKNEDFSDNEEEMEDDDIDVKNEEEKKDIPPLPSCIVSPALRAEQKRKEQIAKAKEERGVPIRAILLNILLSTIKKILISLIEQFQAFHQRVRPFEIKHTEKQLYYLSISLPWTVKTIDDILLYYPLMSRSQRYQILRMRRDKLKTYQEIYENRVR